MVTSILRRRNFGILFLFLILYAFSINYNYDPIRYTPISSSSSVNSSILQNDTVAPSIHNWSHSEITADEYFIIWANVTDDESGIHNVTAFAEVVQGDANDLSFALESNGSLYVTNEAILSFNNSYRIWIEAYDTAMNHRSSYSRLVDLIPPETTKDPYLTMPFVIGTTIILLAVIILLAIYSSKRRAVSK